jgi:hypothetical protein
MSRPAITFRLALAAIARVLDEGARTHSGDWRDEPLSNANSPRTSSLSWREVTVNASRFMAPVT